MNKNIRLFTIGFTKKSAEDFFELLRNSGIRRIIDVRLDNASQMAGFAKINHLPYLLKTICGIDYVHITELAPTKELRDNFLTRKIDWPEYGRQYFDLMKKRKVWNTLSRDVFEDGCLLCSEEKPDFCHRSIVAEHLREVWGDI